MEKQIETPLQEYIERLQRLHTVLPTNTKENRAIKGAYVHAIMIAKELLSKEKEMIASKAEDKGEGKIKSNKLKSMTVDEIISFWYTRNPVHDIDSNGQDRFWGTLKMLFDEYAQFSVSNPPQPTNSLDELEINILNSYDTDDSMLVSDVIARIQELKTITT